VNILQHSSIYQEWWQYFIHDNEYFEFLLGDPRYMGEEMFMMWRIGRHEIIPNANMDAVHAYNKMHASYMASGMGYWRVEKKMEKAREEV
jgi:hypothetical protein